MVIGASLQACAYSLPHLIVGRIVTGIGNGMNTSTVRKSTFYPFVLIYSISDIS